VIRELTERARAGGLKLTGEDGSGNSRNGHRDKAILTEAGPVEIAGAAGRDSSFEPQLVAERQRRLSGPAASCPVPGTAPAPYWHTSNHGASWGQIGRIKNDLKR
jgi:hypothetical protein